MMHKRWVAVTVISILLLLSGAVMAQQNDDGGKVDKGKKVGQAPGEIETGNQSQNSGNTGVGDQQGSGTAGEGKKAGKTAKEKIEAKIKEKLEENVHTANRGENKSIKVREKVKEKLENKVKHARNASENAKQRYMEAKQTYVKTKQKGNPDLGHAQVMMKAGTGYMGSWLERIELQVLQADSMENSTRIAILEKIEEYRNETEQRRETINNTTDIQELRALGKDMNDYWKEVRLFIKSVGYQVAAAQMDNIVDNARGVEVRVAERIAEMNATDANTSRLQELLVNYQNRINAAKENIENAERTLFNATTVQEVAEGHRLVKEAANQIKHAFKDVRLMANEYRKEWNFFGNETGEVFATGDGTANVTVSGIVVAKGYGNISVTPQEAVTTATGFGDKLTGEGTPITGKGVYVVRGDDVSVNLSGEDIYLFTKGNGTVQLKGNWSYKIKELPQSPMMSNETLDNETLTFGGIH